MPRIAYLAIALVLTACGETPTTPDEADPIPTLTPILLVSMADTIAPWGANALDVRAGTVDAAGDTTWRAGVVVTLVTTGGAVDPAAGVTDADGRFEALVSLGSGNDSVMVGVTATAEGVALDTTVTSHIADIELLLQAEFPKTVAGGESGRLELEVGTREPDGTWVPEPSGAVFLVVTGGTAADPSGSVDPYGYWQTDVTMDAGAASLEIHVSVLTDYDATADTTLVANNPDLSPIKLVGNDVRAWLQMSAAPGGQAYNLYRDNGTTRLQPNAGYLWSYTSSGARDGKTCEISSRLEVESNVQVDDATGLINGWSSLSELSIDATSSGLTGTDDPRCTGNSQVQNTLVFEITEGTWKVSWSGLLLGEPYESHENWKSDAGFRDPSGLYDVAPPDQPLDSFVTIGPGEYSLYINTNLRGAVGASIGAALGAEGGHTLDVTFERVGAGTAGPAR